jgi:hypothetical protein
MMGIKREKHWTPDGSEAFQFFIGDTLGHRLQIDKLPFDSIDVV